MKKQAGMTLIELVIVIIVLGIIAAVAAPKFADISGSASTAARDGSTGALKSAYVIATAATQGIPDYVELTAQLDSGFTCAAGVCSTADFDGTGGADLAFSFYQAGTCLAGEVADAATELVVNYTVAVNGGAAGACTAF